MGSNRRYADSIERRSYARMLARAAAAAPLQSLTRAEVEVDSELMTRTPRPLAARAWVRFGAEPYRVECQVHAWTRWAAEIEFLVGEKPTRAWVWRGAVRPNDEAMPMTETFR